MSDATYTRLDDEPALRSRRRSGCFGKWFRRREPTEADKAREAEQRLSKLMLQLPAWMADQDRQAALNEDSARNCMRRGNRIQARVHARAVMAHRRYQERLGQFYATVNEARILQQNTKVASQMQSALGVASEALQRMIESMSHERVAQLMDTLREQREDVDEIEAELAQSIAGDTIEREIATADIDPDIQAYLDSLVEPVSPPIEQPVATPVAARGTTKKKQMIAT